MSAKTETIHVRISSGVRLWQVLLAVAALAACLFLGLLLGRASAPAGAEHPFNPGAFAPYACTGHVPSPACELKVARGYGHTAHIPVGGAASYG